MFTLFSAIARTGQALIARRTRLGHAVIPRRLLESAEATAGQSPRHARELRSAAVAYLSVVR